MGLEWLAPTLAAAFLLAGTVTAAIISARTSRHTTASTKAPTAEQAWREADQARARARVWEDLYYLIRGAFKGYARRMQDKYEDEAAINDRERSALEAPIPEYDESDKS